MWLYMSMFSFVTGLIKISTIFKGDRNKHALDQPKTIYINHRK